MTAEVGLTVAELGLEPGLSSVGSGLPSLTPSSRLQG